MQLDFKFCGKLVEKTKINVLEQNILMKKFKIQNLRCLVDQITSPLIWLRKICRTKVPYVKKHPIDLKRVHT